MNSPARILFNYAIKRKSVYRVENTLGDKAEFFFPYFTYTERCGRDYGRIINFILRTYAILHYLIKHKSTNRVEGKEAWLFYHV